MDKIQKRKKKTNKLKNTHPKYNTLERYLTITFMIFRKIKKIQWRHIICQVITIYIAGLIEHLSSINEFLINMMSQYKSKVMLSFP